MTIKKTELYSLMKQIRATAGDMTLQRLSVLLVIAMAGSEGISLNEIAREANLQPSNTSKLVHSWGKLTARKQLGPGYVVAEADPMDLSTKYAKLTPNGREFIRTMFGGDVA